MLSEDKSVLTDELLQACARRAAGYDRDNRFFIEDFAELKEAGYLLGPVPKAFGGGGLSLAESCRAQSRLAYHAPPTALGLNMHLYWVGVAADLYRWGDTSLQWMLEEAAAGEVFAAGHAERGNDLPLFLSTTVAKKVDGGYRFTGHKMFGSLSPVWTRYGLHAMDADAAGGPQIIHAFLPRDAAGYEIKDTWDVLGMRATRSDDTILHDAFVEDKYIGHIVGAGQGDPFVLAIFAWANFGFASVYYGLASRAIDLVLPGLKEKTSLAVTRSMAYHPEIQHAVAEMMLTYESLGPMLGKMTEDWSNDVNYGEAWPAKIVATKYHLVEGCWKIVDTAMDVSGGFGMFKRSELERLFRDARCGRFHPANSHLVHEVVAKTALGIDLGEQPRWG